MPDFDDAFQSSDARAEQTALAGESLCRCTEPRLATQRAPPAPPDPEATARLVHELRMRQIDLEMRNDALRRSRTELEISRARYFDLYDLAPVGYLTLSAAGVIEEANLAAASLLDRPRAVLIDQPLSIFICAEDQDVYYRCRQRMHSTRERQRCELRLARTRDQPLWVLVETCLAPQAAPGQFRWHGILIDITARKRGDQVLLDAQARLQLVTELADLTFWEWDPKSDWISMSSDRAASLSTAPDTAPTHLGTWAAMLHPEDCSRILAAIRGFVLNPGDSSEIQYRIRDAESGYRWVLTRLEAILDDAGQVDRLLLVHQDVTRRKASEDHAIQIAQHDPLTGLPSRILLGQVAEHMLAGARRAKGRLAVLFFDLDRFKAINDLHGHDLGDQVLKAVARRLRAIFRAEDLVSRLGGDEFVVILSSVRDAEEAARAAQKAIAALTPAYQIAGHELHCVASLGISLFPQDGDTLGELMQRADLAMYQAKTISPGHYQFVTDALNRQVQDTARMEQRLREAVGRHEFRVVYQPILNIGSGRVTGVEALLRWPRPDGGAIPPATFIPVAESIHLLHEIGQWVIEESCRQMHAWQQVGLPCIPVSVNISTRQFYHPRFVPDLATLCRETHADPAFLSLQISEATLLADRERARTLLGELKTLGVRLVMDDFGLGCSSLCELDDLPLDGLAIDRMLVQRLGVARRAPAIVDTIIHLSHALHLDIVAVGVDSEADLRFLREHRCDQVQGFYLGAPMSGSAFIDWYHRRQPVTGSA